jgi:prephenate dehydrogenase
LAADPIRIAVVGVGLIGGSAALAARARAQATVTGYDNSPAALREAVRRQAVDRAAVSVEDALQGAQAAFVAAPVGALPELIARTLEAAGPDCVVTDVGSTKRAIVTAHDDPRFVGGHPLAGAETAGVAHARADLFEGATWYLTPTSSTSGVLYERLFRLLHALGAHPSAIDADRHDALLAAVSHLPHVLANLLVTQAARTLAGEGEMLAASGPSFRDATRVAGAPSSIWTDIYLSNRAALTSQLEQAIGRLQAFRDTLADQDRSGITRWNEAAAADRRRLLDSQLAGEQLFELRASVPNRPGVVAELALALGRAGVNITDMALHPARDMTEGVVALWVAGEAAARRAEELVAELGFPVARA